MSFTVVGIGEVLWDLLPSGPQLGGAPANFAYHAHALGARSKVVTRVGRDLRGQEIQHRLAEMDLPIETVQLDDELPTGTVEVALSGTGVPQFTICENVAWDRLAVTDDALEAVRTADAVCFGSLAQRHLVSRSTIQQLLTAANKEALRIFDINLRQDFYSQAVIEQSLGLANVLKLNNDELSILGRIFAFPDGVRRQIERLAETFALKMVALTRGPEGSLIYKEGSWSEQGPRPILVADTVGAGDAFAAALALGVLSKMDLDLVHSHAAEVAGFVCSKPGATPALPQNLRNKFI